MKPLLEVHDLSVSRLGRTVLSVDYLDIKQGEVLAVIGPNGAGKSTLLLTLARLQPTERGQIVFDGKPANQIGELAYRRRLGLVLQEPLLMDTSVFENVAAGLRFRHLPGHEVARRVDEWISRLGIAHLRDRPARRLSGGEAQRVSLARAFALQPDLLLLDEPFSALDAPTRARLLEDFQSLLAATSITTIFITHDLDEALLLGDRVAVILDGRLRQVGTPPEVFNSPADEDVAAFVGVETVIQGQVVAVQDGQVTVRADGLDLQAVGEAAPGRSVLLCLRPEDITLWPQDSDVPRSSARNLLKGRIQRITPHGRLTRIVVDCGFPLVALVTRTSVQEMPLTEKMLITATFKASAVHLIPR